MIDKTATPIHEHDCDGCVFLGQYTDSEAMHPGEPTDIYWCACADGGTLIRRYGPAGKYASHPHFVWHHTLQAIPWMREAVVVLVHHLMEKPGGTPGTPTP